MSVAQQAKAKRRQMKNGYRHLAKLGRPVYKKKDAGAAARRLAEVIAGERARNQRKGMKKPRV